MIGHGDPMHPHHLRIAVICLLAATLPAAVLGPGVEARPALAALAAPDSPHQATMVRIIAAADAALAIAPTPLAAIVYEGRLDTDPQRKATVAALADMDRLADLHHAWLFTGRDAYAAQAARIIDAWTATVRLTGNAINENKLWPILQAEDALRPVRSAASTAAYEAWLRRLAEGQTAFLQRSQAMNNWHSKAMRLCLAAGLRLGDAAAIAQGTDAFQRYVAHALRPDGSSVEIEQRDALSYHVAGLKPLLEMAILMRRAGGAGDLYRWRTPEGASLERSVAYVAPYARGERVYLQWRNTRVELDRRRAAAGIAHYQPGTPFDPRQSRTMWLLAAQLDPAADEHVHRLEPAPHETAGDRDEDEDWLAVLAALR